MFTGVYTEREEMLSLLSDMHKDAYGFRPRGKYSNFTVEEMNAEVDILQVVITEEMEAEAIYVKQQIKAFKKLLVDAMNMGAADHQTALRWIWDGAEVEVYSIQDIEHFVWGRGFLFSSYGRYIIRQITLIYEKNQEKLCTVN